MPIPEGLKKWYIEDGMSQYQIALEVGVSQTMVGRWLSALGIRARFSDKKDFRMKNHPAWRGGIRRTSDGRVKVKCPGHPRADTGGYVYRQILVWEKYRGPVPEDHVVHHLNGIKDDDRIRNFRIMKKSDHSNWLILHIAQERIRQLEKQVIKLGGKL
jgi:hypothetical protein